MNGVLELCGKVTEGHCGYCQTKRKSSLGEEGEEPAEAASEKGRSQSLGCLGFFFGPELLMRLLECGWSRCVSRTILQLQLSACTRIFGVVRCFWRLWAHSLTAAQYQALLDCGWRRSGKYVYKPIMDKTCCPQYTIRLDSHAFTLSRSHRRVLRVMNEYLKNDVKPKHGPILEQDSTPADGGSSKATTAPREPQAKKDRTEQTTQKKKQMRRERCFKRWAERGLDVEQMKKKREEKEEARRRTIESYLGQQDDTWKHKFEVRLVSVDGNEIKQRAEESFQLYKKYQMTVHNDDDATKQGHKRFLMDSPMENPYGDDFSPEEPHYGSYHQWYLLDDKLIAVGVVDILPRCVSSKYMYYDPDYNFLSIGTYTALREIEFTRRLSQKRPELKYYYMGYYIQTCPKMRYKGKFHPSDLLCDRSFQWVPLSECQKMFAESEDPFVVFRPGEDAPRKTRQDLVLLVNGRVVRYSNLGDIIEGYSALETPKVRSELDELASYLAVNILDNRFYIFVPFIHTLANEEVSESSPESSDD